MAIRDWRPRWILTLSLVWVLGVIAASVARAALWARSVAPPVSNDEIYVVVRLWGGGWALLGPPLLLTLIWLFARRGARPAS
jgi:hypothetical protein